MKKAPALVSQEFYRDTSLNEEFRIIFAPKEIVFHKIKKPIKIKKVEVDDLKEQEFYLRFCERLHKQVGMKLPKLPKDAKFGK